MNIVGIRKDTGKALESQIYIIDEEKEAMTKNIQDDAEMAGIEITISEMTDEELKAISPVSVD